MSYKINPIALRMSKTPLSFGRSESNRVKGGVTIVCAVYKNKNHVVAHSCDHENISGALVSSGTYSGIESLSQAGLPQSEKNIWKMNFFLGQGKVREFCGWQGKFRKDLESQEKVREFENKWLYQAVFRKFIYSVQEGLMR